MKKIFLLVCTLTFVACSDSEGEGFKTVDAPTEPDAPTCEAPEEPCNGVCLDLSADNFNCGACGNVCDEGSTCVSGTCSCPPDNFVPANPLYQFDGVQPEQGAYLPFFMFPGSGGLHGFTVGYDLNTPTGTDLDVEVPTDLSNPTFPVAGVAYNININTQSAEAQYVAVSGTINFDSLCAGGASGTGTNLSLVAISATTGQLGNCTVQIPSVSFNFGDSCP